MNEVLFAVHDYLHAWAYDVARAFIPSLEVGFGEITPGRFEDYAFVHLLSEAVATVGLDYWYLSATNLNEVCPIGTTVKGLTSDYRQEWLPEYRRANPKLRVQSRAFFESFVRFYCTGELIGFDVGDLGDSPALSKWLRHELLYGQRQRRYIRWWLSYLAGGERQLRDNAECVNCDRQWQRDLTVHMGEALWGLVFQGVDCQRTSLELELAWSRSRQKVPDFRFVSLNALDDESVKVFLKEDPDASQRAWLCRQYVSAFLLKDFEPRHIPLVRLAVGQSDFGAIRTLTAGHRRLDVTNEQYDVFLLA